MTGPGRERKRRGRGMAAALVLATAVAGLWLGLGRSPGDRAPAPIAAALSVPEALGGDDAGFTRATAPRAFAFPVDHGPHPGFRTEWWYWTGHLSGQDDGGRPRRFGFQLTFFRRALAPTTTARPSAWGARDVYLAHFAVTDVDEGRFHAADRWARGALELGGATATPLRIWVGSWTAEAQETAGLPIRLRAADGPVGIDLALDQGKPPVLHGNGGLSWKGGPPGNASYYYSLTRMPATGTVVAGGRPVAVRGLAWMDREWSTSELAPGHEGWDWFALQLDDGRELMLYRLRRQDGQVDPASSGTLVAVDGRARTLGPEATEVAVLDRWTSPRDGTRYPARWRVRVPDEGLDLTVTPLVADQELSVGLRYWEGAVRAEGTARGRPLRGSGYVELVGYAGRRTGGVAVRQ